MKLKVFYLKLNKGKILAPSEDNITFFSGKDYEKFQRKGYCA